MFPSPYGVLFILMFGNQNFNSMSTQKFPSPYGVLFILISVEMCMFVYLKSEQVSVSLRSIIHSYDNPIHRFKDANYYVSVSLRSIIHSYSTIMDPLHKATTAGFRLLTEYYSFLYAVNNDQKMIEIYIGFRLLTEYYSFLL